MGIVILAASTNVAAEGEKIFLDYDEAALDAAYNQANWADNIGEVYDRLKAVNEQVLAELGEPQREQYGNTPIETLDWYRSDRADAPIHIHIHGGGWRFGEARRNAFVAAPGVRTGAHVVIPNYVKVTDSDGDLMPQAEQLRAAVAWVYRNAERMGADPERILLSGHSSGAHMAAVVMTTDWSRFSIPADVVKQGLLISGMYDLYPVSLSARNEYVTFTAESVAALSPQRHIDRINADLVVAVGGRESPEFQRQSQSFVDACRDSGKNVRFVRAEAYNHFEIIEDLGNTRGEIGVIAVEQLAAEAK
jgi:arylformamidase